MKNPTLTIKQSSNGDKIEGIFFDVDYTQGYSAGNLLMLMIKEGLDDKVCCERMKELADKIVQGTVNNTTECQNPTIH